MKSTLENKFLKNLQNGHTLETKTYYCIKSYTPERDLQLLFYKINNQCIK